MKRVADALESPGRVVLAEAEPLRLGRAALRPATRELIWGDERAVLEPRVVQTLVALAQAGGQVVSRDALVERCWGGLHVGEDAINRALSMARKAGRRAGDAFAIETIPRVGYRLVIDPEARPAGSMPASVDRPRPDRRVLLAAGVAGLVVSAGAAAALWRPGPSREAQDLYRRARAAISIASAGQYAQAVAFLEEAVRIEPDYAEAWGALSMAYFGLRNATPPEALEALAGRQRAAAERALALDPKNPDANAAMGLLLYRLGSWEAPARYFRAALEANPNAGPVRVHYARVLADVGRIRAAYGMAKTAFDSNERTPRLAGLIGELLWSLGDTARALVWMQDADRRWPRHTAIWFPLLFMHAFAGRPQQAEAMAEDATRRPLGVEVRNFEAWVLVARAQASKASGDRDRALAAHRAMAQEGAAHIGNMIGVLATFGNLDEAFQKLRLFYLGEGSEPAVAYSAAQGAYLPRERRMTRYLFRPDCAALLPDPRFARFCIDVGLEAYWRSTNEKPDFRLQRS
jgi:DNA-binding winged helix-turn-helix (wHTH) protein/Tfp pilus assembly protein PilF